MNSADRTRRPEESIESEKMLIIGSAVTGAALFGLFFYLLKKITSRSYPSGPPPIIVKSGSFIIETENELTSSGSHGGPYIYKRNFRLAWVRVLMYNEDTGLAFPFQWFQNPKVEIWFDYETGGMSAAPNVIIEKDHTDFKLTIKIDNKLKLKKSKHYKRKKKYEDQEDQKAFRFGRVEINGAPFTTQSREGDQYVLAFYED